MPDEFTATIVRDGEWVIAWCPKVAGANGQGKSETEALDSLRDAIALIREDENADDAAPRMRAAPI